MQAGQAVEYLNNRYPAAQRGTKASSSSSFIHLWGEKRNKEGEDQIDWITADDQERKSLDCTKGLQEKEGEGGQPDSQDTY